MKTRLLLTALLLTFIGSADAQTSVALPGLDVTLSKNMTVAEVKALFPDVYTFEHQPALLETDELVTTYVVADDYDYVLELAFFSNRLLGLTFSVDGDPLFNTWFKALAAAAPGAVHEQVNVPNTEVRFELWKSPAVSYRITIDADPLTAEEYDIFFE